MKKSKSLAFEVRGKTFDDPVQKREVMWERYSLPQSYKTNAPGIVITDHHRCGETIFIPLPTIRDFLRELHERTWASAEYEEWENKLDTVINALYKWGAPNKPKVDKDGLTLETREIDKKIGNLMGQILAEEGL